MKSLIRVKFKTTRHNERKKSNSRIASCMISLRKRDNTLGQWENDLAKNVFSIDEVKGSLIRLDDNQVNTAGADNANGSIQDSSHQSNASGFVEDTYSVDNKSGPGEVTGKDGSQVMQVVLLKTQVMQW